MNVVIIVFFFIDKGPVHQRLGFRPNKAGDDEGDRSEVSEDDLDLSEEEDYQVRS